MIDSLVQFDIIIAQNILGLVAEEPMAVQWNQRYSTEPMAAQWNQRYSQKPMAARWNQMESQ